MVTFFAQVQQELYLLTLLIPIIMPMISLQVGTSSKTASGSVKGSADSMVQVSPALACLSTSDVNLF